MDRHLLALMLLLPACDARLADSGSDGSLFGSDAGVTDGAPQDSPGDAALGPFGVPTKHTAASSTTLQEDDGALTPDGLEMAFSVVDATDGTKDIYYTKRNTLAAAWSAAVKLGVSVTAISDETPRWAADGLTLYFASGRAGAAQSLNIYSATRAALGSTTFATPAPVAGPNSTLLEKTYTPCGGRYLVVQGTDIAEGIVGAAPTLVATLNSASIETGPYLTPDCLRVYFASNRDGAVNKIFLATRASITDAWSTLVLAPEIPAMVGAQEDPWLSPDERILSFAANVDGTKDQYIVAR